MAIWLAGTIPRHRPLVQEPPRRRRRPQRDRCQASTPWTGRQRGINEALDRTVRDAMARANR